MLFDAKRKRLRAAPLEVNEGPVTSVAIGPDGRIAAGYGGDLRGGSETYFGGGGGVVLFDPQGERLRPAALEVDGDHVTSVAFGLDGKILAGYLVNIFGGASGLDVFDADPASWRRKAGQVANRNFTRLEWGWYFPETAYRRTIRSLPWPHDLLDAERKQAEAFESEHSEESDAL